MNGGTYAFLGDERAVAGLPIRLLIAVVLGIASFALMMNALGGVSADPQSEIRVEVTNAQTMDVSDSDTLELSVSAGDENDISGATVTIEPDTAKGDVVQRTTQSDGSVSITDFQSTANVSLRTDQNRGTFDVDVRPPGNSDLKDEQDESEIVIVTG
ncbi:hypothetical protein [Haloarcula salinisoli]|uniref:Carboxypeptidase regulatory-like domain-containing protein n=1 Tax=Haloarcula salinisoli TaxID=2487746 RepID=A0A8J8C898_9EURY|nr:hypothetical protein [Halomicroarcula salinisoli]MBX0285590.1 hypothetical protein [Halomicroarcula salinisoli]MBX0302924.1 hypothetical protein [Halomicroarcula salinisoli]